jgi:hypothetical protein
MIKIKFFFLFFCLFSINSKAQTEDAWVYFIDKPNATQYLQNPLSMLSQRALDRRANQNIANPSGLLQGAIMMLNHIGETQVAEKVQNAWLKTLEDGIHTYDIYKDGVSKQKVGTKEFADAVIANLGAKPQLLQQVAYPPNGVIQLKKYEPNEAQAKSPWGIIKVPLEIKLYYPGYISDKD